MTARRSRQSAETTEDSDDRYRDPKRTDRIWIRRVYLQSATFGFRLNRLYGAGNRGHDRWVGDENAQATRGHTDYDDHSLKAALIKLSSGRKKTGRRSGASCGGRRHAGGRSSMLA
jgi:hypothetical protein